MEFSTKEHKILSTSNNRDNKLTLYIGIIVITIAIGFIPYYIKQANMFNKQFEGTYTQIKNIIPQTDQEITMKEIAINSTKYAKEISLKYQYTKFLYKLGGLVLIGIFIIGFYIKSRSYINLIKKLRNGGDKFTGLRDVML